MTIKSHVRRILSTAIVFGMGEACYVILMDMNESHLRRAFGYIVYNAVAIFLLALALLLAWTVLTRILSLVTVRRIPGPVREGDFAWFEVVLSLIAFHAFFIFYRHPIRRFDPTALLGILIAWAAVTAASFFLLGRNAILRAVHRLGFVLTLGALVLSASILVYNGATNRPARPTAAAEGERPNVLLISIDTLRADALSCYGHPGASSPNIDRLASQGVLFRKTFSPSSWTYPAMASLITSLPPPAHAIDGTSLSIRDAYTTLAEVFRANGYYTGAIIGHPVLNSRNGYSQGFDYFDVIDNDLPSKFMAVQLTQFVLDVGLRWRPSIPERSLIPTVSLSDDRFFYFRPKLYASAREITDEALEFLHERPEAPFFLHLHFFDPHGPYHAHPRPLIPDYSFGTQESLPLSRDLYQGEVAYCDRYIGRLLDHLEATGLRDNTFIVLTADHGEGFLEHDLLFHGNDLHAEEVKIPLIISGPGIPPGKIVETPATLTDIGPTITGLAGIARPEAFLGSSLEPVLRGDDGQERMIYSVLRFNPLRQAKHIPRERRRAAIRKAREEFGDNPRDASGYLLSVRTRDRSFICLTDADEAKSARLMTLYDIEADPYEQSDISSVEVERTEGLRENLLDWYRRNRTLRSQGKSVEEREKLRALGYIF